MPLQALLLAGAEAIAQGRIATLARGYDSAGRMIRGRVTERVRDDIRQRVERRLGRSLTGSERRELGQIVDAADNANRQAMKLDRAMGRAPRPSEIDRLPGTGNRGGSRYSYTAVVTAVNPQTGERRTFTVVVQSDGIEDGDVIRARALEAVNTGDWTTRQGTDPSQVGSVVVERVQIISVYRGSPDVA